MFNLFNKDEPIQWDNYLDKAMLDALLYLYKGRRYSWDKVCTLIRKEFNHRNVFENNLEKIKELYES